MNLHSGEMGRPKKYKYPDYMTWDGTNRRYVVRNPLTNKTKTWTEEKESEARAAAKTLNEWIVAKKQEEALNVGLPTIQWGIDWWKREKLQFEPWDEGTRVNALSRIDRFGREMGSKPIATCDCLKLETWLLSFFESTDQFNKWRHVLDLLWKFFVSKKLAATNEAQKIERRSTSKKLAINRKKRRPIDTEGYAAVYEKAPEWLQLAMDVSLVTLQARNEVCVMQHPHFRDGFLYVIRDKVSADTEMAFIKIKLTAQIEDFQRRSRKLDDTVSPMIIHRKPDRTRQEWREGKLHWTAIKPQYLTRGFAEARDQCERYKAMPEDERPTFHEIRGLGSRLYEAAGMSKKDIQALMTHSNPKTTEVYLEGGLEALSDDDFVAVAAPMNLTEALKTKR